MALSGNIATYTTSTLNAGSHSIVAVYSGDGTFAAGTSPAVTQYVTLAWLSGTSAFTWNAGNQTLTITGNATITADPSTFGIDPTILDSGNASQLVVDTLVADGGDGDAVVHIAAICGNGATTVIAGNALDVGNFSQATLANNGSVEIDGSGAIGQLTGSGNLVIGNSASTNTVRLTPAAIADSVHNTQAAVTISAASTLDIADNRLLLNYGSGSAPLAAVQAAVASGAIISSMVNPGGQYTVGYADATEMGTIPTGNVELMYTLPGDARMVAAVNFMDFSILQDSYNQTGLDWAQGDFNHDGKVNFLDFSLLQNSYNQSVKLTPTLTWTTPAAVGYGTALSAAQLDAAASLPGTFTYTPAAGTVPAAGTQVLGVTFTPTDAADFYTVSASVHLTVNQAATTTTVASSNISAATGVPVTFTATIHPASGSGETGTVQFQIDGVNAGSPATVSGNTAAYTTSTLAMGNHTIVAVYTGDGNFTGSTSPAITQKIGAIGTTTAVTSSNSSSTLGQPVTFTATVTVATSSGETGTIQFQIDGGIVGGPVALSGNTATYTTSMLAAGTHSVVAVYSGDSVFNGSTSPAFSQKVSAPNPAKPTVTYILSINDDGTGHYCAGHYAVYASDTTNNGGLASFDINLSGAATITNYSPKGDYDDGTGCGTDDEIGFTVLRTVNNVAPVTGSQDTAEYAGGGEVILVYGFGQTAGNLAGATVPGSTGHDGATTQAVYGTPVELIKGTFTGATPTFTSTGSNTGNVFTTSSGYDTEAPTLAYSTVTVVSGSVQLPAAIVAAAMTPHNNTAPEMVYRQYRPATAGLFATMDVIGEENAANDGIMESLE